MRLYDKLIAILDAFIDIVEGSIDDSFRIRGIQTAMLLEQATACGSGISISEISHRTGAPRENVRRHITAQLEVGNLRSAPDPDDDRITRIFVTEKGHQLYDTAELVRRLGSLTENSTADRLEGTPPYDEIIAILLSFMRRYSGGMRVQGIKRELLIQRATLEDKGITIGELAQQTCTPRETVRRHVEESVAQGILHLEKDPNDERMTRVMCSDPDRESQRVADVVDHLAKVDWAKFQNSRHGS